MLSKGLNAVTRCSHRTLGSKTLIPFTQRELGGQRFFIDLVYDFFLTVKLIDSCVRYPPFVAWLAVIQFNPFNLNCSSENCVRRFSLGLREGILSEPTISLFVFLILLEFDLIEYSKSTTQIQHEPQPFIDYKCRQTA